MKLESPLDKEKLVPVVISVAASVLILTVSLCSDILDPVDHKKLVPTESALPSTQPVIVDSEFAFVG